MKNKKAVIAIVALFLLLSCLFAACRKKGTEPVVVTDENGVAVTDEHGEFITIVPETSIVTVTDGNGNVVTNENGETETSIYYKPQQVVIPVTDYNHEAVTDENGEVKTTVVWFPTNPTTTVIETVPVTDNKGNEVTDDNGSVVTETTIISAANESYSKTMGGSGSDNALSVVPAADGGTFAAITGTSRDGMFESVSGAKLIATAICKYSRTGDLLWTTAFGGNKGVNANKIIGTKDGGVIIVGETKSSDFVSVHGKEYDAFIIKLDKNGKEEFRKVWGGTSNESFYGVGELPDGSIIAAGFAYSQDGDVESLKIPFGESRAVIIKYSAKGDVQKALAFGGFGDYFTDLAVAQNGDIFAVASLSSDASKEQYGNKGYADAGIFKFKSDLSVVFARSFGGSKAEYFPSICATNDGGCIIAGASSSADGDLQDIGNKGGKDAVIAKFTGAGKTVFVSSFVGAKDDSFSGVAVTAQGYIIAAGTSESGTRDFRTIGNKGGKDAFVVRFNANGSLQSAMGLGGSGNDSSSAICFTSGGQTIITGTTSSTDGDFSNMKPASDGKNNIAFIRTVTF